MPELLPGIENSSVTVITADVYQADDGEEMRNLDVRQKRLCTPSPHSSCSSIHDEQESNETMASNSKPAKSKDKGNQSFSKSSLPRPLKREKLKDKNKDSDKSSLLRLPKQEKGLTNKKVPKSK